jgi:hypothetical protein
MTADSPTIICLTPVKDEAWILDRFIRCASLWADHIVIADQGSEDGSWDIASRHDNVTLVHNPHEGWDERSRQHLLINTARALPTNGQRILISLDADEALSANWTTSPDWDTIRQAPPGTVIGFHWANVLPGFEQAWVPPDRKWFCFVDDGHPHHPDLIHGPRLPVPEHAPRILLDDLKVLHFQYTDWDRMQSKQRWYQAWERLTFPEKRPVEIFRQYNHMHGIPEAEIVPLRDEWLSAYEENGIPMRRVNKDESYRWDREIVAMLDEHGVEPFRKIAIWDVDWSERGRQLGHNVNGEWADPRSTTEKYIHHWLMRTQPFAKNPMVRLFQKTLQLAGW